MVVIVKRARAVEHLANPKGLRNYLKTPLCHSELVSESPNEGKNPDEILKQVQDDTSLCVLR